jgi:predicted nicotinamide N-methyase
VWRPADLRRYVDAEALLRDETPAEPPYWMHLWPGAMALARVLAEDERIATGARVLELGCGLGLPALVAAHRGARVVASDWHRAPLQFVRRSGAVNGGAALDVVQMSWAAPALRSSFDLCVGADVGYDAGAEASLVAAAARLVRPRGWVWLADSVNTARGSLAARLVAAGFAVTVRSVEESEEGRPVWVRLIEAQRRA